MTTFPTQNPRRAPVEKAQRKPNPEDAFIAGFDFSAEGYNGEYGGPSNEQLRRAYREWLNDNS